MWCRPLTADEQVQVDKDKSFVQVRVKQRESTRERARARVFERERQEESEILTTKAPIRGMLTFKSITWTLTCTSHTNTHFTLQYQSRAKRPVHKNELSPEELQKQMDHFTEVRARIICV